MMYKCFPQAQSETVLGYSTIYVFSLLFRSRTWAPVFYGGSHKHERKSVGFIVQLGREWNHAVYIGT